VLQPPATAQQLAYIHLQDRIVSGALPGGSRLKPEALAQVLGISRMPVREAIRQLNAEGYVTIRPNRGAIVTSRTPEEVLELFEMRAVLEGLAARLAAGAGISDEIDDLELSLARLRRLRHDHIAWVERHDQFHDHVCALSRRERLCAEIRRLRLAVQPYLRLYVRTHAEPEIAGHEHELILEAIRSGSGKRAETVMRAHVMANAQGIADCLRAGRTDAYAERVGGVRVAAPKKRLVSRVKARRKSAA
jgi:DNA-binding GntR family transcriptional regulator